MGQQALSLAATAIYYLPCAAARLPDQRAMPAVRRLRGWAVMAALSMLAVVGLALAGLLLVVRAVLWLILLEALLRIPASAALPCRRTRRRRC